MRVESQLRVDRDSLLAVASYGITVLRLVIAAMGAIMISRGGDVRFGVMSIVLVMVFDYFDGATFDKSTLSAVKEWRIRRRIADSLSDRLAIQIICIPLLASDASFVWLYLPILFREIAISGYISRQFAKGVLVYPHLIGKIACAMVGVTVISFMLVPFGLTVVASATMIILSALALFDYLRRVKANQASCPKTKSIRSLEEIF